MSTVALPATPNSQRSELIFPLAVMAMILVLIVPLPTALLDVLLTLNLSITVLLLLVTMSVGQPMELSVFPSTLLVLTLARLSLNVATTRLILLQADAGKIVETFGNFVVGGNLVVGLVVFLILVVIQFVVITKGATRISEVCARFTLDAMPGKQMSIDADLNSGSINDVEAKRRRSALLQEAEFHGTMDGASKFVRGDAIAGLVITAINLVGGIIIGMLNGMPLAAAVRTYSILSIGDGLISQIPALITAIAAGLLLTKSSNQTGLGSEIGAQFLTKRRPLQIGAGILGLVALAPGMPMIPFLLMAAGLWSIARKIRPTDARADKSSSDQPSASATPLSPMEEHLSGFLETERAAIEIGSRLLGMVEPPRGLTLIQRIGTLRRDLAKRSGLWIPLVHIHDSNTLEPQDYRILIGGQEVARGVLHPDRVLAISPDGKPISVNGLDTKDPTYGLPAKWISENDRSQATMQGSTVVDPPSVLITHLREVCKRYASELLSREDVSKLVEQAKQTSAAVVDELIPNLLSMGAVHRVLIALLEERVPITNLTRILEALAHYATQTKDPLELADRARSYLPRAICEPFLDAEHRIHAIIFDPHLELELRRSLQEKEKRLAIPPEALEALIVRLATALRETSQQQVDVALLVDSSIRRPIRHLLSRGLPDLSIIAISEVPTDVTLEAAAIIKRDDVFGKKATANAT